MPQPVMIYSTKEFTMKKRRFALESGGKIIEASNK